MTWDQWFCLGHPHLEFYIEDNLMENFMKNEKSESLAHSETGYPTVWGCTSSRSPPTNSWFMLGKV